MRNALAISVLVLVVAASTRAVPAKGGADELALRDLDKKWADAFMKKDAGAVVSYYADDAVVMDPGPALQMRGKEQIRKSFADFFAGVDQINFTMHDAAYRVVGNLGYGHTLFDMSYKDGKTGQMISMKGRALTVFEKRGGKWVAVADHASFPMPAEAPAGKAAMPAGQ